MNKIIVAAGMAAMFAGCAFNPESMPIMPPKDTSIYVDPGAAKTLYTKESKAKVAVVTSLGAYAKDYKQVGETLDSSLNAKLSGFSFFQVVDRKSQAALIQNAVASGADPAESITGVEADFVVVARIASLNVQAHTSPQTRKAQASTSYSADVVFDFRWISVESKRVVMTESIKKSGGNASSPDGLVAGLGNVAEEAVKEFCAKIAVKYAPEARVLETRGNGAAARISIGSNYGVTEHTDVCFYEIVDNSDVGGEKRDKKDIATGKVKRVEEKTAWVKVKNADETNVRKGVYVRVLGSHEDWSWIDDLLD